MSKSFVGLISPDEIEQFVPNNSNNTISIIIIVISHAHFSQLLISCCVMASSSDLLVQESKRQRLKLYNQRFACILYIYIRKYNVH